MSTRKEETLQNLIVDVYEKLKSGDAVARKLNISRKTVYRLLHKAGIVLPDRHDQELYNRRKSLQGEVREEAIQDYIDGMSLPDMRKKYSVGNVSIHTAIKDAGVPRRPHGGQARRFQGEEGKEIARLYVEEKLSQAKIAAIFNTSQPVISRVLQEQSVIVEKNARGENHGNWVGGRVVTGSGYVQVMVSSDDPMAVMRNRQGYVLEHRLVMARALGRPLTEYESVHHLDGDHLKNDLSNLQLRIGKHGKGQAYQCADCGSYHVVPVELKEESVSYEV